MVEDLPNNGSNYCFTVVATDASGKQTKMPVSITTNTPTAETTECTVIENTDELHSLIYFYQYTTPQITETIQMSTAEPNNQTGTSQTDFSPGVIETTSSSPLEASIVVTTHSSAASSNKFLTSSNIPEFEEYFTTGTPSEPQTTSEPSSETPSLTVSTNDIFIIEDTKNYTFSSAEMVTTPSSMPESEITSASAATQTEVLAAQSQPEGTVTSVNPSSSSLQSSPLATTTEVESSERDFSVVTSEPITATMTGYSTSREGFISSSTLLPSPELSSKNILTPEYPLSMETSAIMYETSTITYEASVAETATTELATSATVALPTAATHTLTQESNPTATTGWNTESTRPQITFPDKTTTVAPVMLTTIDLPFKTTTDVESIKRQSQMACRLKGTNAIWGIICDLSKTARANG